METPEERDRIAKQFLIRNDYVTLILFLLVVAIGEVVGFFIVSLSETILGVERLSTWYLFLISFSLIGVLLIMANILNLPVRDVTY